MVHLATQKLYTFGYDLYGDYELASAFTLRLKAGYETKGLTNKYNTGIPGLEVNDKYSFNYLSSDLVINYNLLNLDNKLKPLLTIYPFAGLSFGYLLSYSPVEPISGPGPYVTPLHDNFEDYATFNLGAVYGIGINIKDLVWLEMELNNDILAPLQRSYLVSRNRVNSVNVGLNVLQLLKNIKT